MFSLILLLLLAALVLTILNAVGKCPLWVPVLLVILILLASNLR